MPVTLFLLRSDWLSIKFFIAVSSGSSLSMGFVDRVFFLTGYLCHFAVATILGRYLFIICTVSLGHDWKYNFWIVLIHVDLTGTNAFSWRYLAKYFWFLIQYMLLILCYISLSRHGFLFSKVTRYNPLVLSCVPIKILPFMMWKLICVKTEFHPASNIL